jgi:hypothetical protein
VKFVFKHNENWGDKIIKSANDQFQIVLGGWFCFWVNKKNKTQKKIRKLIRRNYFTHWMKQWLFKKWDIYVFLLDVYKWDEGRQFFLRKK